MKSGIGLLLSDETQLMVKVVREKENTYLAMLNDRTKELSATMTMWEVEQMMRQDALIMHQTEGGQGELREDGLIGDKEFRTYGKYSLLALATFDEKAIKYRIDPFEDVLPAWERAKQWALDKVASATWTGPCDQGRPRRFISENDDGLKSAMSFVGFMVRYDIRSAMPQVLGRNGIWLDMNDRLEATIRQTIAKTFSFARRASHGRGKIRAVPADWSSTGWNGVFNAVLSENSVDSFAEWLERLEPWDTKPRLDSWLNECGLKLSRNTPDELIRWVSTSIVLIACTRTLGPGLKHDTIPVLVGPQGIAKSTALAWLMPEAERGTWFSDSLRLSADEKRRVEALQGAVIVEAAEMSGATTADIESLKAFLSRTNDRVRLAYRKNPEPHPRMCSIVGTANGTSVLPNDPTGNRRFVAVLLDGGDPAKVRKWLDSNRSQLWAEARFRALMGEQCQFPSHLEEIQAEANESVRSADSILEEAVGDYIQCWVVNNDQRYFTLADMARRINILKDKETPEQLPTREVRRLSRILDSCGCKQTRMQEGGVRRRMWEVPRSIKKNAPAPVDKQEVMDTEEDSIMHGGVE